MNNCVETTLYMVRGDSKYIAIETDGDEITLSGAWFTVKKNKTDSDYVFQKSLSDGITQEGTEYTCRVAPEDTDGVEPGNYYYDLQIASDDDKFTILRGILAIYQDITLPRNEA